MTKKNKTILEAKKDLLEKKYSAHELLSQSISKIEELDPTYHVFVNTTFDQAREAIKKTEGDLFGIPGVLKDNFNWKGTKTTASSKILQNYISPYNATVTQRLLDNNACLVGKTNMDAFAHGSSTETSDFFPTLNPFDKERVAGGSSGGSATAVALGMGIYGIGSETAGSVRGPAAWCGLIGFAPTFGRISRYGVIAMGSSLDRPGFLTNSVDDAAYLLKLLSGADRHDATTIQEEPQDLTDKLNIDLKGIRIGMPKQYFDERIDNEVLESVMKSCKLLESKGAKLVEIDLMDPKYSIAVYTVVQRSEVSSNLARIDGIRYGHSSDIVAPTVLEQVALNREEGFGHEAKQRSLTGAYTLSSGYYDAYYRKAQKVRTLIIRDFAKAFENVDVVMAPTMPTTAWIALYKRSIRF